MPRKAQLLLETAFVPFGHPRPTGPPDPVAELLARKKRISVKAAADLNDLSEDTFRRHYGHLIRKVTPRRDTVTLGDAIDLPPPE